MEAEPSRALTDVFIRLLKQQFIGGYPNGSRGKTLVSVADFSGTHAGSPFTSYAFLTLDIDRNAHWLSGQRQFRSEVLRRRRMSYKALNDAARRKALRPFLLLADEIVGALTVVIIPADFGPITNREPDPDDPLLRLWKLKVQEHVLRVTHLGGAIAAMMSRPLQNLLFVVDQDEVASNVAQLTQLTELVALTTSVHLEHDMGHMRVGTTLSDDGSLALEDLCAIADLAAGASCEMFGAMAKDGWRPVKGVVAPLPRGVAPKAHVIGQWLCFGQRSLQRSIVLFESSNSGGKDRLSAINLEPIVGHVWT
jgi:hypothetical protein